MYAKLASVKVLRQFKNKSLYKKLGCPFVWITILVRLVAGLVIFVNPWIGWLLYLFFDLFDFVPWCRIAGLTQEEYEFLDKRIDSVNYFTMLLASFTYGFFPILIVFYLYRVIGENIFYKKGKRKYLILFPNLFEVFWVWYIVLPNINILPALAILSGIWGLYLLILVKVLQEFFCHLIGPKYIFPWNQKVFWSKIKTAKVTKYC